MKHAYLILAHDNWELLKLLVSAIDDERNDIYIHFDAKCGNLPQICTQISRLIVLDNRVDARWGDVSLVEAEYALFEAAYYSEEKYDYFHLLSGVDLPLKSQDYIHSFFETNSGKEFIGYSELTPSKLTVRKVSRWHLFPRQFRSSSLLVRGVRAAFLRIQEILGIYRNRGIDFKKGSQWVSITPALVAQLLFKKEWVLKTLTHTFCPDEIFVQTICWNSNLRGNIFRTDDDASGCMRAIAWRNACIYDWVAEDYPFLASCDALFARKFNLSDRDFLEKILKLSQS